MKSRLLNAPSVFWVVYNVFGLCARWRFKALTFNFIPMMIEAQMFNLPLHRHWRKTRVVCQWGLSSTNVRLETEQKFLKTKKARGII